MAAQFLREDCLVYFWLVFLTRSFLLLLVGSRPRPAVMQGMASVEGLSSARKGPLEVPVSLQGLAPWVNRSLGTHAMACHPMLGTAAARDRDQSQTQCSARDVTRTSCLIFISVTIESSQTPVPGETSQASGCPRVRVTGWVGHRGAPGRVEMLHIVHGGYPGAHTCKKTRFVPFCLGPLLH